jgi:hypothetical protein
VRTSPASTGAIPSFRDDAGEADVYSLIKIARHRVSKVSESSGAHACESNGLLGFSGKTLVSSLLESSRSEFGRAEASAGHSNNDFASMGLPSYQHFRPSITRQDQCPCGFDDIVALHFCFACAVGISIDESVAIHAAKVINGVCFLIQHLTQ